MSFRVPAIAWPPLRLSLRLDSRFTCLGVQPRVTTLFAVTPRRLERIRVFLLVLAFSPVAFTRQSFRK